MKKIIWLLIIFLVACPQLALAGTTYNFNKYIQSAQINDLKLNKGIKNSARLEFGAVSHHLPTALPLIADFYQRLADSEGARKLFIIIGPDHREACLDKFVTTDKNYQTPFGITKISDKTVLALNKVGLASDPYCFNGEHSMGVQAIMIGYYFPQAEIVPILVSSSMKDKDIKRLIGILKPYLTKATFIASVDYSHYLSLAAADQVDEATIKLITTNKFSDLKLANVDSPASLKILAGLAKINQARQVVIATHGNSAQFTGKTKSTTSYINFFIKK